MKQFSSCQFSNQHSSNQQGAVLAEYAMVIPILVLVATALFLIASVLWQLQVLAEGLRYGARTAVSYSRIENDCEQLKQRARVGFETYLVEYANRDSSMGKQKLSIYNSDSWWNAPEADVYSDYWDGYGGQYVTLSVQTSSADNCILCTAYFARRLAVAAKATFPNMKNCT